MEIFAHRGGTVYGYGNTIRAFQTCLAMGVGIEADVQWCSDSLIITHRDKIGDDPIARYPLDAVRRYVVSVGGQLVLQTADVHGLNADRIPTLTELLTLLAQAPSPKPRVLLDVKNEESSKAIREFVVELGQVSYVIYGAHSLEEAMDTGPLDVLLFASDLDAGAQALDSPLVQWVRFWQSWLTDGSKGEFSPRLSKVVTEVHQAGKKIMIMAGAPTESQGGEITRGQLSVLMGAGVDGVILNDPALALNAIYCSR